MWELFALYKLNYAFVFLAVLLSIASCYIAINLIQYIKVSSDRVHKRRYIAAGAILLGVTFWVTHIVIAFSVKIPFSILNHLLYFAFSFAGCVIASYIAIHMAYKKAANTLQYVSGGIVVIGSILTVGYPGFSMLFSAAVDYQPVLVCLTVLLVTGISFSVLRFISQLSRETSVKKVKQWKYIGGLIAGIALSGVPYLILLSMLRIDIMLSRNPFDLSPVLIPYGVELAVLLVLGFVPDVFGEQNFREQATKLRRSEEQYKSFFKHHPDAVFMLGLNGKVLSANVVSEKISGFFQFCL